MLVPQPAPGAVGLQLGQQALPVPDVQALRPLLQLGLDPSL